MSQPVYTQPQSNAAYVTNHHNYGDDPLQVQCYNCRAIVTTTIKRTPNLIWCWCLGCWAYCCPCTKDTEHRCPQCNVILDIHKAC